MVEQLEALRSYFWTTVQHQPAAGLVFSHRSRLSIYRYIVSVLHINELFFLPDSITWKCGSLSFIFSPPQEDKKIHNNKSTRRHHPVSVRDHWVPASVRHHLVSELVLHPREVEWCSHIKLNFPKSCPWSTRMATMVDFMGSSPAGNFFYKTKRHAERSRAWVGKMPKFNAKLTREENTRSKILL